jgi:hypothetical protein
VRGAASGARPRRGAARFADSGRLAREHAERREAHAADEDRVARRHQPQAQEQWAHREAVFEHFRSKKAFAKWDEQVLHDYIDHGTFDGEDTRELSFDRDVETAIYNTLPHNLGALLRRHPLKCKVAFIGGRQSAEMKQVGMAMTQKVTKGRIAMLDAGKADGRRQPVDRGALHGRRCCAALVRSPAMASRE